jgi:hypothetical protein
VVQRECVSGFASTKAKLIYLGVSTMKPVQFSKSPKFSLSKAVVSFLLVVVLAACGTNAGTVSSSAQLHPSSTPNKPTETPTTIPTATPTTIPTVSPSTFNPNAAKITDDTGSLLIQSFLGFQCPNDQAASGFGARDQLVFTSDPTTYSQNKIAQIQSYMQGGGSSSAPPSTLQWILGGSVDPIPGVGDRDNHDQYYAPCGVDLTLTNNGNASIQIPQVGVQLQGPPEQNSYQYRLVDACSLGAQPPCPPVGGGGPVCSKYSASIQLGLGEQGTVYSAVPQGEGDNCGTLTIAPSTQVDLILVFSLTAHTPKNLIYSIVPVFTVDTAQGQQTLTLPHLGSTLVFASANQFSCYALQGSAFVLLQSPSAPPNWCM